jgi:hypothetical protein
MTCGYGGVLARNLLTGLRRYFIRDAFDSLAMGNYPFPTNYIAGTVAKPMPAWLATDDLEPNPPIFPYVLFRKHDHVRPACRRSLQDRVAPKVSEFIGRFS